MTDQVGLYKFKLSQKRYQNGAFYLSAIVEKGEVKALDGRFFVEGGSELGPTKNGFRIPVESVAAFRRIIGDDLRDVGDRVLFENKSFRFHIRYVNDRYGEGIDFRKYRTSEKYTGWDRSGVRMKLEDVRRMREWLTGFDPNKVPAGRSILCNIDFSRKPSDCGAGNADLSPAIKRLLDF